MVAGLKLIMGSGSNTKYLQKNNFKQNVSENNIFGKNVSKKEYLPQNIVSKEKKMSKLNIHRITIIITSNY